MVQPFRPLAFKGMRRSTIDSRNIRRTRRHLRHCHMTPLLAEAMFPESRQIFYERLDVCSPRVERLGIPCPSLAIRSMRARWGSCSRSDLITPNPRLVQTPRDCIDYVLLHAWCHLKEHHHGKQDDHLLDQRLCEMACEGC